MFKLNLKRLIRQITIPNRRMPKRLKIAEVLLTGLNLLWEKAEKQYQTDLHLAKFVPQKKVIAFHLDRILEVPDGTIIVEDGIIPGTAIPTFIISNIPDGLTVKQITEYNNFLINYNIIELL